MTEILKTARQIYEGNYPQLVSSAQVLSMCQLATMPKWNGMGRPRFGMHFPAPIKVGRRNYFSTLEVQLWITARAKFKKKKRQDADRKRRPIFCDVCGKKWPQTEAERVGLQPGCSDPHCLNRLPSAISSELFSYWQEVIDVVVGEVNE